MQRQVVRADPRAGLAVAIDIGDRYDIHPTNKQQVGRRLGLEARRLVHGDTVAVSPQPVSAQRDGEEILIAYPADTALWIQEGGSVTGLQVCDAQDACVWAEGRLAAGGLRVTSPAVAAAAQVRYCWADSPICNLYGPDDLPAMPFELDID